MSGKQTPIRNEPLVWQGNGHPINNLEGQVGGKNQQIVWEGNGHIVGNPEVGYMEEKKQASPPKLKSGVNFGESQFGNIEESKIIRQE